MNDDHFFYVILAILTAENKMIRGGHGVTAAASDRVYYFLAKTVNRKPTRAKNARA